MIRDKKAYQLLVIEDNLGDYLIVEDLLTDQILEPVIIHATDFKKALHILDQEKTVFDVILLDLTLPDKDGQELVSEMLSIALSCPIIILTGFADLDFSIQSISQGISDYLVKDDLNATILYKSILYAIERSKVAAHLEEYIKEIEKQNGILKEIAWIQSHKVRAPLARMMGMVELMKEWKTDDLQNETLLGHFVSSGQELDHIIREIALKTESIKSN